MFSIDDPFQFPFSTFLFVLFIFKGNHIPCRKMIAIGILNKVTHSIDSPEVNVLSGLVTLDANVTSGCFSVMAVKDNTVEGDEMVPLTLSVVNNTATLNSSQVLITVQDGLTIQGKYQSIAKNEKGLHITMV